MRPATLLIIEDEERMRRVLELALQQEGYELLLAESGEEGIRQLYDGHDIVLIITDLQLGQRS